MHCHLKLIFNPPPQSDRHCFNKIQMPEDRKKEWPPWCSEREIKSDCKSVYLTGEVLPAHTPYFPRFGISKQVDPLYF